MLKCEEEMERKDTELALLKARLLTLEGGRSSNVSRPKLPPISTDPVKVGTPLGQAQHGKALPVEPFTGERSDQLWEEWFPTLERAAFWYSRSEQEKLLQLAGYLRGKAQREWDLLKLSSKQSFDVAIKELGNKLNLDGKAIAAQGYCHLVQHNGESVVDFISQLERTSCKVYGHENMSMKTHNTLLYGQLHEGLRCNLLKSPAVSGAIGYTQLCVAARTEERRQNELSRRQHYQQEGGPK